MKNRIRDYHLARAEIRALKKKLARMQRAIDSGAAFVESMAEAGNRYAQRWDRDFGDLVKRKQ